MQCIIAAFADQLDYFYFGLGFIFVSGVVVCIGLLRTAIRRFRATRSPRQMLIKALEDDAWKKYLVAKEKYEKALRNLSSHNRVIVPIISRFSL